MGENKVSLVNLYGLIINFSSFWVPAVRGGCSSVLVLEQLPYLILGKSVVVIQNMTKKPQHRHHKNQNQTQKTQNPTVFWTSTLITGDLGICCQIYGSSKIVHYILHTVAFCLNRYWSILKLTVSASPLFSYLTTKIGKYKLLGLPMGTRSIHNTFVNIKSIQILCGTNRKSSFYSSNRAINHCILGRLHCSFSVKILHWHPVTLPLSNGLS